MGMWGVQLLIVLALSSMMVGADNTTTQSLEYCYRCNGEDCKHFKDICTGDENKCYIAKVRKANSTLTFYEAGCTNLNCLTLNGKATLCQGKGTNSTCSVITCCEEDFCNDDLDNETNKGNNLLIHLTTILFSLITFNIFTKF